VWWYNIGIFLYSVAIHLAALWNHKARLWIDGRKGIFPKLREAVAPDDKVIWFHAASLGEFEQGRPLMEEIRRRHPAYKILLTFFSPSGYEIRKDYKGADWVFYLPTDRPCRVKKFLDAVHPEIAVFIKYEFWLNYLHYLGRRGVRTYLISSIFRRDSIFFRPWGGAFRKVLRVFDRLFVQNTESKELLANIGITRVEIAGDTRFDRVIAIAESPARIECVELFTSGHPTVVAGSTWAPDEAVLGEIVARHPEMRFVVAPHEMNEERIRQMQVVLGGGAVRYSECVDGGIVPDSARVMIVDTFGILSTLYRYGQYAYVGGGFGSGIHNILEAVAYGLPVAFGPNCERFREARDLRALGVATVIENADRLDEWMTRLMSDPAYASRVKHNAQEYIAQNRGATQKIIQTIFR
jgi:3-deoxy-D-manno-octulosonic-acid transferase